MLVLLDLGILEKKDLWPSTPITPKPFCLFIKIPKPPIIIINIIKKTVHLFLIPSLIGFSINLNVNQAKNIESTIVSIWVFIVLNSSPKILRKDNRKKFEITKIKIDVQKSELILGLN